MESACKTYLPLLSAYADGEVNAKERSQVELHLSGCADCRARLADLKAVAQLVSARMTAQAEEVDFSGFADAVMARVTPQRPGLLERMRVAWREVLAYHRTALVSSLATAAVTLALAVPLVYHYAVEHAVPEVVLKDLQFDDAHVKPVVMKTEDGKMVIMLVHQPEPGENEAAVPDLDKEPPKEGDL
jgi:anti-sigma factor RsiW